MSRFELSSELRRALEAAPPCKLEDLAPQVHGGLLREVHREGSRRLYAVGDGPLLWASMEGEQVAKAKVLSAREAERTWSRLGTRWPDAWRKELEAALTDETGENEVIDAAFGKARLGVVELGDKVDGDQRTVWLGQDSSKPRRKLVLELHYDGDRLSSARPVEGADAWALWKKGT